MAKLNPALKKEKKSALSHDQGSSKWPFNLSTDNCLKNSSQQQHEETLALLHDHDMYAGSDDEHGAASTASSLSLSRLRYAVLSIVSNKKQQCVDNLLFQKTIACISLQNFVPVLTCIEYFVLLEL